MSYAIFHFTPFYFISLQFISFYFTALHNTLPQFIAIHSTSQHFATLQYTLRALLRFTTLHWTLLHFSILKYIAPHSTTLHFTTIYFILLHYNTPHFTIFHYTSLHFSTLCHISLHFTTLLRISLHFTTLRHITLHCTALHFITLHYISPHSVAFLSTTLKIFSPQYTSLFTSVYFTYMKICTTLHQEASVKTIKLITSLHCTALHHIFVCIHPQFHKYNNYLLSLRRKLLFLEHTVNNKTNYVLSSNLSRNSTIWWTPKTLCHFWEVELRRFTLPRRNWTRKPYNENFLMFIHHMNLHFVICYVTSNDYSFAPHETKSVTKMKNYPQNAELIVCRISNRVVIPLLNKHLKNCVISKKWNILYTIFKIFTGQ